jgi:hypothetical protein
MRAPYLVQACSKRRPYPIDGISILRLLFPMAKTTSLAWEAVPLIVQSKPDDLLLAAIFPQTKIP